MDWRLYVQEMERVADTRRSAWIRSALIGVALVLGGVLFLLTCVFGFCMIGLVLLDLKLSLWLLLIPVLVEVGGLFWVGREILSLSAPRSEEISPTPGA